METGVAIFATHDAVAPAEVARLDEQRGGIPERLQVMTGDSHVAACVPLAERDQQGTELAGLDPQRARVRSRRAASFAGVEMHQLPHVHAALLQ